MSKIKIKYDYTKDFAIDSAESLYDHEMKNSNKRFIGWFFIALTQFGVVGALKHDSYGFLVISSFGIIYWYGLRWNLRKYFIVKSFNKSSLANSTIELDVEEDGLYLDNEIQLLYKDINKIEQLDHAIILYHTLGTTYIPNNAFNSREERGIFKQLIKV